MAEAPLYRRSPHVVAYWSGGRLVFHNFATGARVAGTALTIGLLDYFDGWKAAAPLLARSTLPQTRLRRTLGRLVEATLLQRSTARVHAREHALEQWTDWNPAAGFFHFSTRDPPFEAGEAHALAFLARRAATHAPVPIAKSYPGRRTVRLPRVASPGAFARVLLRRRTWRRFGPSRLPLRKLAALLELTFGARRLMGLGAAGPAMLRTSPSAGARHPIEAYVVVRHTTGLASGIYHYAPLDHRLVRLSPLSRGTIERHLPGQAWYGRASVVVLMTAVWGRTSWKYPSPRAYRDVLLEAGHFCQTFCLVATSLGLAPFCTGALADSIIERDLGLDGASEGVVYACGAGTRPAGVSWAPVPEGEAVPRLIACG